MLALAFFLAGWGATASPPCVSPRAPALPAARWLLPKVIVEGGSGPGVVVWLSWRLGGDEDATPRRPTPHRRSARSKVPLPMEIDAPLEAEESQARARAGICP
jgi:hypothetical protein